MFTKKISEIQVLASLNNLMTAGISVQDAALRLSERMPDAEMSEKLYTLASLVGEEGYTLPDALRNVNMLEKYCPILDVGQKTGNLKELMKEIVDTEKELKKVSGKVKSSLIYPAVTVVISVLIGYGLTFILENIVKGLTTPKMKELAAFKLASFIATERNLLFGAYVLILLALTWLAYKYIHKIPLIKDVYNSIALGQAFRMFAIGSNSGLPPAESFMFSAHMLKGRWRELFEYIAEESENRNISEIIDEIERYLSAEDYLILKIKIESGNTTEGFEQVGSGLIAASIQKLGTLSSLTNILSTLFVAGQIISIMAPLYSVILAFMGQAAGKSGAF